MEKSSRLAAFRQLQKPVWTNCNNEIFEPCSFFTAILRYLGTPHLLDFRIREKVEQRSHRENK